MRFYKGKEPYDKIKEEVDLCLCHKEYNHCVSTRDDGVIIEIDPNDELETLNVTQKSESQLARLNKIKQEVRTTTTESPQIVEALGFEVRS